MGNTNEETAIGVIVATAFVLIGVALVAFGAHIHRQRSSLRADGLETVGVVVGFDRIGKSGGTELLETTLVPVVRFSTASGQEITFSGSTNTSPPWADYRTGGTVAVIYDPRQPEKAMIDSYAEIWFAPLLLWLIGGGAILIPPWTIWRHVHSRNAPRSFLKRGERRHL